MVLSVAEQIKGSKDRQPNPIDDDRFAFSVYAGQMLTLVVIWHAILPPDGVRP